MLIRVRRTRTHPAADWTSSNPWLGPLEMGVEEEAPHKAKINFSDIRVRWNDLDYWDPSGALNADTISDLTTQTPVSDDLFAFVAVPTSRVVRITALGQGTVASYLRVRASAGGAILATGTVSAAATSATIINRGAGTAAQYAAQIRSWFTGVNATAVGSPTDAQDGDSVVITWPVGSIYNTYVFETDDPQIIITEEKENGNPCNILVTGLGAGEYSYRFMQNGVPAYNLVAAPTSGIFSAIYEDGGDCRIVNSVGDTVNAASGYNPGTYPYQLTWTDSTVTAIPAGTDAVLRKVSKAEMGVVCVLGSVTVDLNTTDLQLSQVVVPTGKVCVVTGEIVRNASVDLTGMTGNLFTGWDATDADDLWATHDPSYNFRLEQLGLLTTSSLATGRNSLYPRDGDGTSVSAVNSLLLVGTAGQTLGFKCSDAFGSAATVTVDVLGYFV